MTMNANELLTSFAFGGGSGGGSTPTGTKEITISQNGTTTEDVAGYAEAEITVDVPQVNKEADFIQGSLSGAYQNAQATSVCGYAFKGMTSLTEVSIPNAATVGYLAFQGCSALEKAEVDGATSVANYAFSQLANLEEVSCRNCGSFGTYVFRDCVSLESVVFPKAGVIGDHCFQGCTNLETIDVGGNGYTGLDGRKIGSSAFDNCSSLTALILREQAFVSLDNVDAFTGTPIASGTGYIYVPNVWKSIYQGTQDWASLSSQFRSLEDYTVDGTITGALDPTKI